jgi:hypothetical protein
MPAGLGAAASFAAPALVGTAPAAALGSRALEALVEVCVLHGSLLMRMILKRIVFCRSISSTC